MKQTILLAAVFCMALNASAGESFKGLVVKRIAEHGAIESGTCGHLSDVINKKDSGELNMVIARNISENKGHYHKDFTEVYVVVDGEFEFRFYDPAAGEYRDVTLGPDEICIVPAGIHHAIAKASPENRLYVITLPGFSGAEPSDKL